MFKKLYIRTLLFSLLMGLGSAVWAQAEAGGITEQDLLRAIMFTMIVMAVVALLLTFTILTLVRARFAEKTAAAQAKAAETGQAVEDLMPAKQPWSWGWMREKLTDAVPVAKEADIDLGHDYDGIRELDNNLPPWWKYGFYFTIAWSVVYLLVFHVFGDWSSDSQYEEEMAQAEAEVQEYMKTVASSVDENNVTLLADASALESGKAIYDANCAACHGMSGEGGIGPTFADNYWIHGGDISNVFSTIKYGVPAKGMIAWQDQLRPEEMQQVASYLMSFVGTTPPNMKEPQGDLYEPEAEEAPAEGDAPSEEEATTETGEAISMN